MLEYELVHHTHLASSLTVVVAGKGNCMGNLPNVQHMAIWAVISTQFPSQGEHKERATLFRVALVNSPLL
jgi:hypothetical protein